MAYTLLGNVYVPHHFLVETIQRSTVRNALWQSGIITSAPELIGKARQGGRLIDMPFWQDIGGNSQRINSGTTLTVGNITSSKDQAVVWETGTAFGAETIAGILAQSDPMSAIQDLIVEWWNRDNQDTLIAILTGVFGAATMAALVLNIAHQSGGAGSSVDANWLNADSIIDAVQLLGDAKGTFTALVMHSKVHAFLDKQDLIDFEKQSESETITLFRGHRVILDDRCPVNTVDGENAYTTYIFGAGAIGYEEDTTPRSPLGAVGDWYHEEHRVALQDLSALITRKRCLFHPRGVKWTDNNGDTSPTNAQFSDSSNWSRVFDVKNMRMAAIVHNIES